MEKEALLLRRRRLPERLRDPLLLALHNPLLQHSKRMMGSESGVLAELLQMERRRVRAADEGSRRERQTSETGWERWGNGRIKAM